MTETQASKSITPFLSEGVFVIPIQGIMGYDVDYAQLVAAFDAAKASSADAVALAIDSPGGYVYGSEPALAALRKLAKKKPCMAIVNGCCASMAYEFAIECEQIIASPKDVVGSIGVYFVDYKYDTAMIKKDYGVDIRVYAMQPGKVFGNSLVPLSDEEEAANLAHLQSMYDEFANAVASKRKMKRAEVDALNSRWFYAENVVGSLVDKVIPY